MRLTSTTSHRPGTAAYSKGQDTIARIIDTAFRLAVTEGFAKVTIRRIARELAISPGNLSYYYARGRRCWHPQKTNRSNEQQETL